MGLSKANIFQPNPWTIEHQTIPTLWWNQIIKTHGSHPFRSRMKESWWLFVHKKSQSKIFITSYGTCKNNKNKYSQSTSKPCHLLVRTESTRPIKMYNTQQNHKEKLHHEPKKGQISWIFMCKQVGKERRVREGYLLMFMGPKQREKSGEMRSDDRFEAANFLSTKI